MTAYPVLRTPRHETVRLRGLDMHVTRWGPEPEGSAPPVVLLHGWLDVGGTFQFMVDALTKEWPLVAWDWRGFGRSQWPQEGYGVPAYLGDLDALLERISPAQPVHLVGHSMGGNVASLYAGVRPERVRSLVNLEGLGLPRTSPVEAPKRMRKWLDQLKSPAVQKNYASLEQLTAVIQFRYPRFAAPVADYVARQWSIPDGAGGVRLAADPRHHWVNPVLYKREDAEATWAEIRAPMLLLLGELSDHPKRLGLDGSLAGLQSTFPVAEIVSIGGAGHMLHIEQPELVAQQVEAFLERH
jgi:pimeloyl-ACP methyl ester carboxylesterase